MNKRNSLPPLASVLNAVGEGGEFHVYDHHPQDVLIQRYVDGSLTSVTGNAQVRQKFSTGDVNNWGRAEVALHVKTCSQCWSKVVALRSTQRAQAAAPSRSFVKIVQGFVDSLLQPGPRLALMGAFVLVVGIGLGVALNLGLTAQQNGLPTPTTSSISAAQDTPQAVGVVLEALGLDVSGFALDRPLYRYRVQSGDTLSGIAASALGSADYWILIYLLNYDRLKTVNDAHTSLDASLSLNLPLKANAP